MSRRSENGSILAASTWMLVLSLLLFWLPGLGPFIAGLVGGRKAGTVGGALLAAILPAILLAALVAVVSTLVALPLLGLAAGLALFVWIVVESVPLLIGAAVGGFTA